MFQIYIYIEAEIKYMERLLEFSNKPAFNIGFTVALILRRDNL